VHDGLPLADAIALERTPAAPLVAIADRVIDSSDFNVHQLRRCHGHRTGARQPGRGLSLLFESFAYAAACRATPTSCSMRAACPIRTGTHACAPCPDATPRCANTSTKFP
jgi:hypothetical protein